MWTILFELCDYMYICNWCRLDLLCAKSHEIVFLVTVFTTLFVRVFIFCSYILPLNCW